MGEDGRVTARRPGGAQSSPTSGRPRSAARTRRDSAGESFAQSPGVRSRMQLQRTRDTAPEMALRRLLHAGGLRYFVDRPPLPGLRRRADLVFPTARVAVFVDGCYWHGCAEHGRTPATNTEWWVEKLARNKERDADTDRRLREEGWVSLRFWEHTDPGSAAETVSRVVRSRHPGQRPAPGAPPTD
jgi:DNA mismatch endonuclease (patch repair protein)